MKKGDIVEFEHLVCDDGFDIPFGTKAKVISGVKDYEVTIRFLPRERPPFAPVTYRTSLDTLTIIKYAPRK